MSSPHNFQDDFGAEDAELWAVIDSAAAAAHSSTRSCKPLTLKHSSPPQPQSLFKSFSLIQSPQFSSKSNSRSYNQSTVSDDDVRVQHDGEVLQVLQEPWSNRRPNKVARTGSYTYNDENRMILAGNSPRMNTSNGNEMVVAKPFQQQRSTPKTPTFCSPNSVQEISPVSSNQSPCIQQSNDGEEMRHSLSGKFPSVTLFKEYQNAAMAILEKTDYTIIQGSPFIKKSGWRKIAFYFNLSFEIKDKSIEFDENRNVQRAEFIVRAHMQGGRYSDGWGSCERREKRFMKPNQDIPSTAETRAKNKACQDLLGIGQYRQATS